MRNNSSGHISVFLAIVLLSVLILAGLLVDISRVSAGKAIVRKAADSAAKSILADYNTKLKEEYGIFAIPSIDTEDLNDCFEEYLASNLSIPLEDECRAESTDIFGFRVEGVSITPIFNLSENSVTKQQILEYMKYRAPAQLADGFLERISSLKDLGKMSAGYKKKVGIDKILGSLDKTQQKLKKNVDGLGEDISKYINGFNLESCWENAFANYNSLITDISAASDRLKLVDESINRLNAQKASYQSNNGEESGGIAEVSEIDKNLAALWAERYEQQAAYAGLKNELEQKWNKLRYSLTEDYKKANENGAAEIGKLIVKGEKAVAAIADLESFLEDSFSEEESEISMDFIKQTQDEIEAIKTLIPEGDTAQQMLNSIENNYMVLNNIASRLDELKITANADNKAFTALPAELLTVIKGYSSITYDYLKPSKDGEGDDPRAGAKKAVKDFIAEKIFEDKNYESEGIDKNDLPSNNKVLTPDGTDTAVYEGNLGNIEDEADLHDEEGVFHENALGFISDIGRIISDGSLKLRDNVYINEYIMGTFKCSVPELIKEQGAISVTNLHGADKSSLETFYDSEVEYILHGNPSQVANNTLTKGELLLVRFGLNTLHVYSDSSKKAAASSIATAVAGWWTGGAGIPVISNLIICGWGMGEAIIDLKDLLNGKSVPVYKLKGDWRLDIGLPGCDGPQLNKSLHFNYHDYMRVFLLTMNEGKKLGRVEDLIQLNIGKTKEGFKMSENNTFVMVEAEVSMKYLFIIQPFIKKELKTGDGRYIFKVCFYEGY